MHIFCYLFSGHGKSKFMVWQNRISCDLLYKYEEFDLMCMFVVQFSVSVALVFVIIITPPTLLPLILISHPLHYFISLLLSILLLLILHLLHHHLNPLIHIIIIPSTASPSSTLHYHQYLHYLLFATMKSQNLLTEGLLG